MLLARLGLRAGEVVALTLDDIDWDAGLITVRGKGKRVAQMPVPVDVGTAMTAYLCHARPACASRRVFIRAKAPLMGFANSIAICSLVDRVWIANTTSATTIDVGVAARHSTGDARRLQDTCYDPGSRGNAYRPPARDACPAPPTRRPRPFASALSPD